VGGGKDKAEGEVQAISSFDPLKAYMARATVLQKNKRWDQAKKELMQATLDHPKYANGYKDLAEYLLDRKDFAGARDYARQALALNGESKRSQLTLAAAEAMLHEDLDRAEAALQSLAQGTLGDEDPSFEEVYYWLGKCRLEMGNSPKAREAFAAALAFNPDYTRAKEEISKLK
jgi:tetratricopeptide (TPR) repeat protein